MRSKHLSDTLKLVVPRRLRHWNLIRKSLKPVAERQCPLCGYFGWFETAGKPLRIDARCPSCESLERHRLLFLAMNHHQCDIIVDPAEDEILHFAAEFQLERLFRKKYCKYFTADLFSSADFRTDIEAINFPDGKFKLIIANHVLEHVDDIKASFEIARVLKRDGILLAMVPIIEGWARTYENSEITSPVDRLAHFGQANHLRYYGRDFRERLESGGLTLTCEATAEGVDVLKYGLLRGEKVFVFRKADH